MKKPAAPAPASIFSTPLSVLEKLPKNKLRKAAAEAGLTVEKLRELVKRASHAYAEQQAAKQKVVEAEALLAQKFRLVPARVRRMIDAMQLNAERELLADRLERKAYALVESEAFGREASGNFVEAKLIMYRGFLYEACLSMTLSQAMHDLADKCRGDCRNLQNIPRFRDAARRALKALRKELEGDRGDSNGLPIDGPALVYSVNVPLNFPRHPRPRRSNDELEPF